MIEVPRGALRAAAAIVGPEGGSCGSTGTKVEAGPVRLAAVDALELQLDAGEAFWRSCHIVI